jgi:hypothetical protein
MKRIIFLAFITLSAASLYAQNTSNPALPDIPQAVNAIYMQAPEDALIGIGTFGIGTDMSNISFAISIAETRARADIARQLNFLLRNMVADYIAMSELNPNAALNFQETIASALARAALRSAKTIHLQTDKGLLWVVIEYSKSAAYDEAVNPAVAAAKLAVPEAAPFNARAILENSFFKDSGGGPVPVRE